jgi:hypothetical protein
MSTAKKKKPKRVAEKDDPARMSDAERERFDKEDREGGKLLPATSSTARTCSRYSQPR